jgi:hypothetical protein
VDISPYVAERDREAVQRICQEAGWLDPEDLDSAEGIDLYLQCGRALVARFEEKAESLAAAAPGTLQYLGAELPFSGITTVATSHVARRKGLATRLTARLVALEATEGALVSWLGVFDQGYYDRIGFGSGTYDHRVALNPRELSVPVPNRRPCRLTKDHGAEMHACRMRRWKRHGALTFAPAEMTRGAVLRTPNGFGLGFRDGPQGQLSHHLWCRPDDMRQGPYRIPWMAYQTGGQLLELLGVLKSLGDQVQLITLCEPPDVQLQDLVARPFRSYEASVDSRFATGIQSFASWQARICDVSGCLQQTHLCCDTLRFNLVLDDPIAGYLDESMPWPGTGGEYVVSLGRSSGAERASDPTLPTLTASVNAFTRLWLGVRPATGLAVTDQLHGPPELLERLDAAFRLPVPKWDWPF